MNSPYLTVDALSSPTGTYMEGEEGRFAEDVMTYAYPDPGTGF